MDLNWAPADVTSKNCLIMACSLPPFFFIPNIYEMSSIYNPAVYMTLYKLKSMICFTGNHYFTFMLVRSKMSPHGRQWHLFNDTQVEVFQDWFAVVQYIV